MNLKNDGERLSIFSENRTQQSTYQTDPSSVWVKDNEDLRAIATPIPITEFELQIKERQMDVEFRILARITETNKQFDKLVSFCPYIGEQNRYKNVIPYSFNLVKVKKAEPIKLKEKKKNSVFYNIKDKLKLSDIALSSGSDGDFRSIALSFDAEVGGPEVAQTYINASYIRDYFSEDNLFIATQAPIENGIDKFWHMVWNEDIKFIINLTKTHENGSKQADRYWPQSKPLNTSSFKLTSLQKMARPFYTRRVIDIHNKFQDENRTVIMFHVTGWPDAQAPPIKYHRELEVLAEKCVNELNKRKKPILVHCSAGIGRTGTFIAITMLMHFLSNLESENPNDKFEHFQKYGVSVFDLVRHLREMRWGSVSNSVHSNC